MISGPGTLRITEQAVAMTAMPTYSGMRMLARRSVMKGNGR